MTRHRVEATTHTNRCAWYLPTICFSLTPVGVSVRLSHWALTLALCTIAGCPKGDSVPTQAWRSWIQAQPTPGCQTPQSMPATVAWGAPDAALDCPSSCEGARATASAASLLAGGAATMTGLVRSRSRCSSAGACFEGQCLSHADCPSGERCAARRCLERVDPLEGVAFERVYAPPDGSPQPHQRNRPHDDLRLWSRSLTSTATSTSTPSSGPKRQMATALRAASIATSPSRASCASSRSSASAKRRADPAIAGYGLDLEGDGYHELLLAKRFAIELHRFHPQHEVLDL